MTGAGSLVAARCCGLRAPGGRQRLGSATKQHGRVGQTGRQTVKESRASAGSRSPPPRWPPSGGQAIVDTALAAFCRVDIVISNAGILRDKAFHNMTPELLDPVLDVHLKGAFHVIRPAWVKLREAGYGRVLVTASNAGILGNFGQTNYGAAKMGLVGLARVLAQEGARYNIKANVLAPIARTRMTEELLGPLAPKLDPALVAPVAAWLVSEECPVTGEIYSAGGGRVARFFVGLTEGYANPALTLEDVRDHIGRIRDETGYSVPTGVADEISSRWSAPPLARARER